MQPKHTPEGGLPVRCRISGASGKLQSTAAGREGEGKPLSDWPPRNQAEEERSGEVRSCWRSQRIERGPSEDAASACLPISDTARVNREQRRQHRRPEQH
ncbi:hypothetical protein AAFF_G00336950 [Aldrovandia affinis]|uniref:Uncharacterized protein n=1 Tax=Aldrovandia affinis TaxID=143900 RepID=A0AAD7WPP6_9TELE|nr:hypothetical protein AAFF_G00336950 [Aldrovandia affinis]